MDIEACCDETKIMNPGNSWVQGVGLGRKEYYIFF